MKDPKRVEGFNISLTARMTGLTEFTLRAWEKRYQIAIPYRNESGRRVYSLQEVEKFKLLKQLTDSGHSIKDLAQMEMSQLKSLAKQSPLAFEYPHHVQLLVNATMNLNIEGFLTQLKNAQHESDTRTFLLDVISPFFRQLGEKVSTGELQIYHEHIFSAILRNTLSGLLYSFRSNGTNVATHSIVFATPEGDLHEFGILIGSILCALRGFKVFYLGPNMPAEPLSQAGNTLEAKLLVLSCTSPKTVLPNSELKCFMSSLTQSLRPGTEIWLGGDRFLETASFDKRGNVKLRSFKSFHELERALQKLQLIP